jgi:hypothetical protein
MFAPPWASHAMRTVLLAPRPMFFTRGEFLRFPDIVSDIILVASQVESKAFMVWKLEEHAHWTRRLLADQVVPLGYAESFRDEVVRLLLKKHPETLAGSGGASSGSGRRVCRRDGRCARCL